MDLPKPKISKPLRPPVIQPEEIKAPMAAPPAAVAAKIGYGDLRRLPLRPPIQTQAPKPKPEMGKLAYNGKIITLPVTLEEYKKILRKAGLLEEEDDEEFQQKNHPSGNVAIGGGINGVPDPPEPSHITLVYEDQRASFKITPTEFRKVLKRANLL